MDKLLLMYCDENGDFHTTMHTPYDQDISADDEKGLEEHLKKCPVCAARYGKPKK